MSIAALPISAVPVGDGNGPPRVTKAPKVRVVIAQSDGALRPEAR